MKKISTGRLLSAILLCMSLLPAGCLQTGSQPAPEEPTSLSGKTSSFSMGGVNIKIPQPKGYVDATPAVRQAAAQAFSAAENIFAAYVPTGDKNAGRESGLQLLRNRKLVVVSARPEFNREIVDQPFYQAMQRDIARVNGKFSSGRIAQFKVLTESYYARDDAFSHSLGVYETGRAAISVVRIVRQQDSRGAGAASAYQDTLAADGEDTKMVLAGWDKAYFSRAYHQVAIQNVLFLNGRCFNIYFFAPLAGEEDFYAAMRENKNYIGGLSGNITELNRATGHMDAGGQETANTPTQGPLNSGN